MEPTSQPTPRFPLFEIQGVAKPLAIMFTLRRTTREYAHVKVFVQDKHMKDNRIEPLRMLDEAIQKGFEPGVEWKLECEPVVEMNPIQRPPDQVANTDEAQGPPSANQAAAEC